MLQAQRAQAVIEYKKAFSGFEDRVEYKRLVEVKLNALGVDPSAGVDALVVLAEKNAKQTSNSEGTKK
jgi:hypothetical protein